ncbi:MAG: PAS domain S-box protein [Chloroflexota bacterium]
MSSFLQKIIGKWYAFSARSNKTVEIALVATGLTAVYALIFYVLQPMVGYVIASLIMLPVLVMAWVYGLRVGVIASFAAYFINLAIVGTVQRPYPTEFFIEGLPGHLITLLAAVIVGKFKDISARLSRELTEREHIEQTLQESEQQYRLISENLNDLICLHEVDSRLIYLSSSVTELLGYATKDLLGKTPFHLFHPDDATVFRSGQYLQTIQQGKDFTVEGRMRHKDGRYILVESRIRPFTNGTDGTLYWQSITRDISELRRRESELETAVAETKASNHKLKETIANLSALNHIAHMLTDSMDLQSTLYVIAQELAALLDARNCGVALLNEAGTELRVVASYSPDPTEPDSTGLLLPLDNLGTQLVLQGQSIRVENAQTDPKYAKLQAVMVSRRTQALIAIPLRARSKLIGSIGIDRTTPGYLFTDEDMRLAETIAWQAGRSHRKSPPVR